MPSGYGDGASRPLLVFLHGVGENGDGSRASLRRLFKLGIPSLINADRWPDELPFIVLMPQHDAPPGTTCPGADEIASFWRSRRGITTPTNVAGAVPISGDAGAAFVRAGCLLGRVPIWAFHGEADAIVPKSFAVVPMHDLQACSDPPPVDVRLTLYPGAGHDVWTRTYDGSAGHDIYAWFLRHARP